MHDAIFNDNISLQRHTFERIRAHMRARNATIARVNDALCDMYDDCTFASMRVTFANNRIKHACTKCAYRFIRETRNRVIVYNA
jgi:hypothetical protein